MGYIIKYSSTAKDMLVWHWMYDLEKPTFRKGY